MPVKPRTTVNQLEERVAALEVQNMVLKETVDDLLELLVEPQRQQAPQRALEPLSDVFEINRRIATEKSKDDRYVFSEYELNFLKDTGLLSRPTQKQRLFMDGLAKKQQQLRVPQKPDFEYPKSSVQLAGYGSGRRPKERDPLYREGDGKGSDWDLADEMLPDLGAYDGETPLITGGRVGLPASYFSGGNRFAAAVGDYGGDSYIADRDNPPLNIGFSDRDDDDFPF